MKKEKDQTKGIIEYITTPVCEKTQVWKKFTNKDLDRILDDAYEQLWNTQRQQIEYENEYIFEIHKPIKKRKKRMWIPFLGIIIERKNE